MLQETYMPEPESSEKPVATKESKGEKAFNWAVYGGIAGVGTLVVTVPAAYALEHGRWAKGYEKAVDKTGKFLAHLMPTAAAEKLSRTFVKTMALMQGGNITTVPVAIAEHYKIPTVNKLNEMLGDDTPPEKIKEAPKQTVMSLIEGRLTAFALVFGVFYGSSLAFPKTFATFTEEFADHACNLCKKPLEKASRFYRMAEITAIDLFATAMAVVLLFVGGHFFARKNEEKKQRRADHTALSEGALLERSHGLQDVQFEQPAQPALNMPDRQVTGDKLPAGKLVAADVAQAMDPSNPAMAL